MARSEVPALQGTGGRAQRVCTGAQSILEASSGPAGCVSGRRTCSCVPAGCPRSLRGDHTAETQPPGRGRDQGPGSTGARVPRWQKVRDQAKRGDKAVSSGQAAGLQAAFPLTSASLSHVHRRRETGGVVPECPADARVRGPGWRLPSVDHVAQVRRLFLVTRRHSRASPCSESGPRSGHGKRPSWQLTATRTGKRVPRLCPSRRAGHGDSVTAVTTSRPAPCGPGDPASPHSPLGAWWVQEAPAGAAPTPGPEVTEHHGHEGGARATPHRPLPRAGPVHALPWAPCARVPRSLLSCPRGGGAPATVTVSISGQGWRRARRLPGVRAGCPQELPPQAWGLSPCSQRQWMGHGPCVTGSQLTQRQSGPQTAFMCPGYRLTRCLGARAQRAHVQPAISGAGGLGPCRCPLAPEGQGKSVSSVTQLPLLSTCREGPR